MLRVKTVAQQTDPPTPSVERVVVTGQIPSLLSPSAEEARARLQTVPAATSLYDADDYRLGRHDYLEDFLRYQPGLVISSSQGGEDTHVSSRGSGQNNDDIIGLAILVDGVPINQGDGEAFLHDVDLQTVRYAEVYRGADALRYGGVTLGGAINLVSLTGRDAAPVTVGASFGSFGYFQQTLASGWSQGPWDLLAAASDHVQDGYQLHSQENYQKVTCNLGYRPSDSVENRLYFFYGRLDQNNPAALDKADLYANPRQTDPEAIQEDWNTRWNYTRLMDRFAVQGQDWTLQMSLAWNHRQQTQRSEYEDDFRLGTVRFYSDDYAVDVLFEWNHPLFDRKNRLTAGVLPTFEPEHDSFYANPDGKTGALLFADRTDYLNLPLFAEDQCYLPWADHIWMGVSVEGAAYRSRINLLRHTHARVKFLSVEPLLGRIADMNLDGIDWVIVGGESGPGARPMREEWVTEIRDQCVAADVRFFFKQWGGVRKHRTGRMLNGRTWDEMPRDTMCPA